MTLVDTSAWIHQLRTDGDLDVRRRVEALLVAGSACWCPVVKLELWIAARGDLEKRVLAAYEGVLPELPITSEVWEKAYDLARLARRSGFTFPSADILIAACARIHGADIESSDHHFLTLMAM